MHWESKDSFKDEGCPIGYVPRLSWNGRVQNIIKLVFMNGFELYVKLELFRSSYFGSKIWFY